jgi:hypothetical protein
MQHEDFFFEESGHLFLHLNQPNPDCALYHASPGKSDFKIEPEKPILEDNISTSVATEKEHELSQKMQKKKVALPCPKCLSAIRPC